MSQLTLTVVAYTEKHSEINFVRSQVYEIEQGINPNRVFDGKDERAEHILAYLDNQPVGTARIRCLSKHSTSIEKLAVLSTARRQGIGKKIMEKSLEIAAQKNVEEVVINAQEYIKGLYQQLGFEQEGERFMVAGNPHALIKMRKRLG
ncbi:MAG TPA: GNAT family N-acetyltransferase [Coleofasciculaceae cyanobacterium]|jgi:predicted GNAT family N-acyltransferase